MISTKKRRTLYLFVLPALLLYLFFWITPVLMSFYYGFTNWTGIGTYRFIGLKNFNYLLSDGTLITALKNTFLYALFSVVYGNFQSLAIAMLLNIGLRMRGLFRTVFYIPALFSTIVIGFIWSYVYAPHVGMIAEVMKFSGLGDFVPNFLGSPNTSLLSTAFVEQWKASGVMTVIYLAGLQGISDEVLESAKIDGCNALQTTLFVKLPLLSNTITINVMLGLISGFKAFDYIFTMTHGGPGTSSATLMYTVYKMAFVENQYGLAEALAAVAFLLILAVSVIVLLFMKRREIEA